MKYLTIIHLLMGINLKNTKFANKIDTKRKKYDIEHL